MSRLMKPMCKWDRSCSCSRRPYGTRYPEVSLLPCKDPTRCRRSSMFPFPSSSCRRRSVASRNRFLRCRVRRQDIRRCRSRPPRCIHSDHRRRRGSARTHYPRTPSAARNRFRTLRCKMTGWRKGRWSSLRTWCHWSRRNIASRPIRTHCRSSSQYTYPWGLPRNYHRSSKCNIVATAGPIRSLRSMPQRHSNRSRR